MKEKVLVLVLSWILLLNVSPVLAGESFGNTRKFSRLNPDDGHKYEFVKTYITSLTYIDRMSGYKQFDENVFGVDDLADDEKIKRVTDSYIQDNASLRVARNLVGRYKDISHNSFVHKVIELFSEVCNEQIAINTQERELLERYNAASIDQEGREEMFERFYDEQLRLVKNRKESLKKLLEASIWINKVLISAQGNLYGEFEHLALTQEQRYKLIRELSDFYGERYEGDIRAGQTFLEASVSSIRVFLEDFNWKTLDET